MLLHMLLAGFGGQGILFAGKVAAQVGMLKEKQVSWLPSYGPEMRGGAANCSVIISDEEVGSPLVTAPDILVAMNLPSFDKFEASVKAGGWLIVDSSLINKKSSRTDILLHSRHGSRKRKPNRRNGQCDHSWTAFEDHRFVRL